MILRETANGGHVFISFKYQSEELQRHMPYFQLAMFNNRAYANRWALGREEAIKKETAADNVSPDSPVSFQQICTQEEWDYVRRVVMADGLVKNGMFNPCEGDADHICPFMPIDFDKFADFQKLHRTFSGLPDSHWKLAS